MDGQLDGAPMPYGPFDIKQFRIPTYVGDISETQDCFFLEKLALPEDIQSMVVSRFFNGNVDTLVLDKSSFLSVYHYNYEEISCDFVNNIFEAKSSSGANKLIVRNTFHAVIVVDENVFEGEKYDGPDENFFQGSNSSNSRQILFFWDMILDMSNEQRAQLLQFATGTTLLPPGGFMNLMGSMGPMKFTIYRYTKGTQYLPNVNICYYYIDVPPYEMPDSEPDEIDPTDPTIIDQTAGDGYPHTDLMYFALDSLFHTRARFALQEILKLSSTRMVPPRRHIQRPLAETDNPYYLTLKIFLRLEEFPNPYGSEGDPTTKNIRPPPTSTSGLQPSRFSEPCFALSMLRRGNEFDRQIVNNGRIVVIGSSDIEISVLERLTFAKSRIFSSLTLLSPQCLPCLESTIIPPPAFHHQPFVEPYPNGIIQRICKKKKERAAFLRQVYDKKVYSQHRLLQPIQVPPIIARAAGIPGTQEIVPIPPLWSAKVDPQREKDIQIELLDNEKKVSDYSYQKQQTPSKLDNYSQKPISKKRNTNSTISTTYSSIGSLLTNQPGSIISSVPGNIPATEYSASFINVTPSTYHSLFVIPTPFRPPAPALFEVNSCNYTAATLAGLGLLRYIEEVPGVILKFDFKKRELIRIDGPLLILSVFRDSFANQHNLMERNGFEDEDEIGVIFGATLRFNSVLHGLLQVAVPDKRLLFITPKADPYSNSLNHERRIDAFEGGFKMKYKYGDDEILIVASLIGDLAPFTPFDDPDTQIKVEKYLSEAGVRIVDGWNAISAHTELGEIPIGPDDEEYGIDTLMQIRQPKLKKKSWRRKFAKKKKKV
ncbi:MAG: hypothetical protein EZS28_019372, partial [Streblomastix strix]